jgi:hypothetical protein
MADVAGCGFLAYRRRRFMTAPAAAWSTRPDARREMPLVANVALLFPMRRAAGPACPKRKG